MTRANDLPIPPLGVHVPEMMATWPAYPVLAVGSDSFVWDDPDDTVQWDADRTDIVWDQDIVFADCSTHGLELVMGGADEHMDMAANTLTATLDNRDGRWTSLNADGTSSDHLPGDPVQLWATDGVNSWWLFSGHITRWDRTAEETIELEAFDLFSDLAQPFGNYTPGVNGQTPAARLNAILQAVTATMPPRRFATGLVALTAQATDNSPLEEMEVVVSSDGGVLFCDADGQLVSYDRSWRLGRTDQPDVPTISDNVCITPIVIWAPVLSTNDVGLADRVIVENVAKLRSVAGSGRHVLSESDLQYTSQAEGDVLATFIRDQQSAPTLALESFDLHLLDPDQPGLKRMINTRLFDRLTFVHDAKRNDGVTQRMTLAVIVTSIVHSITPNGWVMTIGTTKSFGYGVELLYDTGKLHDTGEVYGY